MYQNIDRSNIIDSIFHSLVLESINYILKKNIETRRKISEIDEVGSHLGERIANHLLNNNNATTNTKMEVDDIMKFLGRDVWLYVFGKQIAKLQTNRKGTFLIDIEDIKFHHNLIYDKNGQDDIYEIILSFVSGMIKGVLAAFNVDCSVTAGFKSAPILNTITNYIQESKSPTHSYSFTIVLLNFQ